MTVFSNTTLFKCHILKSTTTALRGQRQKKNLFPYAWPIWLYTVYVYIITIKYETLLPFYIVNMFTIKFSKYTAFIKLPSSIRLIHSKTRVPNIMVHREIYITNINRQKYIFKYNSEEKLWSEKQMSAIKEPGVEPWLKYMS